MSKKIKSQRQEKHIIMPDETSRVVRMRIAGPPLDTVKLSAFDCRHVGFFSRRVLVFRAPDESTPEALTAIFAEALRYLVHKVPVLGGRITYTDKSQSPTGQTGWKTITNGSGINLSTRDLRDELKYSDLEAAQFSPSLLVDAELMPIPLAFKTEPYDAADFQLNFIDGGVLLSCCISHVVADGTSDTEILRLLAGYCKGMQEKKLPLVTTPPIGHDRMAMVGMKPQDKSWSPDDHPAMYIREPGQGLPLAKQAGAEVTKIYRIKGDKLAQLKRDAAQDAQISTNDAILCVIWRMLLVNRIASGVVQHSATAPVYLYFPVSAQRFPGLVDPGFIGNTVSNRVVSQFTQGDLLSDDIKALPRLAAAIRAEINSITRDTIASYCQFAESAPSVGDFTLKAISVHAGQAVNVASLLNGGAAIFNSDWGNAFGNHVVRLRCSDAGFTGNIRQCHLILPRMPDGGCEVALCLYVDGVDAAESDQLVRKYFSID